MTEDEKGCEKATIDYIEAVVKYGLDSIEDSWGDDKKRYMKDAFIVGFYAGRDYQRDKSE